MQYCAFSDWAVGFHMQRRDGPFVGFPRTPSSARTRRGSLDLRTPPLHILAPRTSVRASCRPQHRPPGESTARVSQSGARSSREAGVQGRVDEKDDSRAPLEDLAPSLWLALVALRAVEQLTTKAFLEELTCPRRALSVQQLLPATTPTAPVTAPHGVAPSSYCRRRWSFRSRRCSYAL